MFSEGFAVQVSAVSKCFEVYEDPRNQLKQLVLPRLQRALGLQPKKYFREFWALRDLSFDVKKGESCGIVGMNGSGKSTLLQIITGTLAPTSGEVSIQGRIAALLELGSGFNPEFSGRENVYMNGLLLGYGREQINERLDSIIAFADIGEHFDRLLKTYSSGMQMRLAFSVATAFSPDILIVDEALAVGDAYFQQKCFHRLAEFKEAGGTLLFVSHDANTVKQLCDKALFIDHGQRISHGSPRDVIDLYQGMVAQKTDLGERAVIIAQNAEGGESWKKATTISTNGEIDLVDFRLLDLNDKPVHHLESEAPLTVQYTVKAQQGLDRPAFGLIVRDRFGRSLFETSTYAMHMNVQPLCAGDVATIRFTLEFNLRAGQYSFSVGVANRGYSRSEFEEYTLLMHDVEQLQVLEAPGAAFYGGVFNMRPIVTVDVVGGVDV